MFLKQMAMLPVTFDFNGKRYEVPKFTTEDWVRWADELDNVRLDKATKDLSPEQKFRMLIFYNVMPVNVDELKNWVDTPRGSIRVMKICLQRATQIGEFHGEEYKVNDPPLPITKEVILELLTKTTQDDRILFARELADIRDTSKPTIQQEQEQASEEKTEDEEVDPLADLGLLDLKI
jgi:hypothetical protein